MNNLLIFLTTREDRRVYLLRDVDDETSKKLAWFHGQVGMETNLDTAVRSRYKWLVGYLRDNRGCRILDSVAEKGMDFPISVAVYKDDPKLSLVVVGL